MKTLLFVALSALISGIVELWPMLKDGPWIRNPIQIEARSAGPSVDCRARKSCPTRAGKDERELATEVSKLAMAERSLIEARSVNEDWLKATVSIEL